MDRKRYVSLMPTERQESLSNSSSRVVSAESALSTLSMESTVSDFLEDKIQACRSNIEYLKDYQSGLKEALSLKKLEAEEYSQEMEHLHEKFAPIIEELTALQRGRRTVEQDIEDVYNERKRHKKLAEPPLELMEHAYASTMVARVMSCGPQKKSNFNLCRFRKDVIAFLNAGDDPECSDSLWCHLTGWVPGNQVKAAHLVPKCLRGDELQKLFGVGEVVLSDPRNGITLHANIEKGLDCGTIVIVPVPPATENDGTKWKCVLVDEESRSKMYTRLADRILRWNDLDGKELEFRSNNRPARRYLYFRYLMTYLRAKKEGNMAWTERVENRSVFWASPGAYLEKSTLLSLGRNISGFELPPPLYEKMTFNSESKDEMQDLLLSSRLRGAIIESSKRPEESDNSETDEKTSETSEG